MDHLSLDSLCCRLYAENIRRIQERCVVNVLIGVDFLLGFLEALFKIDLMDLETENRIAAILLKEAAEIRRQAEKEGVHAYLRAPQVRGRPNSRFLTATVMGVQQANRTVEVNEMWNIRQKELDLDKRINNNNNSNKRTRDERSRHFETSRSTKNVHNTNGNTASCSNSKRVIEDYSTKEEEDDRCLKDEEIEEFLHSRTKRGRGAVGSRMDEPGPYLPKQQLSRSHDWEAIEEPDRRALVGPKKPVFLKGRSCESSSSSSEDEESGDRSKRRKEKKVHSRKSKHKSRRDKKDKERKDKKKEKKKHKEYYK